MPEDLSASSFCKDRFCKMVSTRKYVYYLYQVYRSTEVHLVHVLFSPFHYYFSMLLADALFSGIENQW